MNSRSFSEELVVLNYKGEHSLFELSSFLDAIATRLNEGNHFIFVNKDSEVMIQPFEKLNLAFKYTIKDDVHRFEIGVEW